jgi:hypothetical protein
MEFLARDRELAEAETEAETEAGLRRKGQV